MNTTCTTTPTTTSSYQHNRTTQNSISQTRNSQHATRLGGAVASSDRTKSTANPSDDLLTASREAVKAILPTNSLKLLQDRKQLSGE